MAYPTKKDEEKHEKVSISFNISLENRLVKFCQEEERSMSWVVRKAVDKWLTERGY